MEIDKIRVMHVAQCAGGVERYLYMMLKNADAEGFEHILISSFEYDAEKFKKVTYHTEQINMCREINPYVDLKATLSIRRLIKKYRPDIVYAHSSKAGAVARIANIGLKSKSIYNPHGWAFNMRGCSLKKRLAYVMIERLLSRFCSKIIAISNHEKESAIRNNVCKKEKVQVIYNGIDFEECQCMRNNEQGNLIKEECGIPEGSFVIGCVGRLSEQKAPDCFVKAAQLVKKGISNVYFLMVGDGELRQETEKQIRQLGIENCFHITGWVEYPMEYIGLFDAAMLLSRWEGFGLVLAEYMLAKKPIIATRVDAVPEIIENDVNGILVNCDNAEEVKEAAIKLYDSPVLCEQLVAEGYKTVKNRFNIKRVCSEHEELFQLVLAS